VTEQLDTEVQAWFPAIVSSGRFWKKVESDIEALYLLNTEIETKYTLVDKDGFILKETCHEQTISPTSLVLSPEERDKLIQSHLASALEIGEDNWAFETDYKDDGERVCKMFVGAKIIESEKSQMTVIEVLNGKIHLQYPKNSTFDLV
jgi:hypothetical protein